MNNQRVSEWWKLPVSLTELCINTTLRCGQSFRWRKSGPGEWSCALHGRILTLRQDSTHLHYRAIFPPSGDTKSKPQSRATKAPPTPPPSSPSSVTSIEPPQSAAITDTTTLLFLQHYLNLSPNLASLYAAWSARDANFRKRAPNFAGIRILRQDPWEALCGFICSSNNNISRISQMMHKLCIHYGPLIGHLKHRPADDEADGELGKTDEASVPYHDFPSPEALTGRGVEAHLRELGFGYRARYIYETACAIAGHEKGGLAWLDSLVNPNAFESHPDYEEPLPAGGSPGYRAAHEALLELQGVGPKVADCVCLMGLGWGEAIPVDTHVWQIAQRDYGFGKGKHASLTKATYDAIGDKLRGIWGGQAGWAHSVLFTADLRAFSERVVSVKVETEMEIGVRKKAEKTRLEAEIKKEDDNETPVDGLKEVRTEVVVEKMVKRPFEVEEEKVVEVHEDMMSRVKRRRTRSGRV